MLKDESTCTSQPETCTEMRGAHRKRCLDSTAHSSRGARTGDASVGGRKGGRPFHTRNTSSPQRSPFLLRKKEAYFDGDLMDALIVVRLWWSHLVKKPCSDLPPQQHQKIESRDPPNRHFNNTNQSHHLASRHRHHILSFSLIYQNKQILLNNIQYLSSRFVRNDK